MSAPNPKVKFPREAALAAAQDLMSRLVECCAVDGDLQPWLEVAGSLRRGKAAVGDVELVYVPRIGPVQDGLFVKEGNQFDAQLELMLDDGIISKRPNVNGHFSWGASNKLAVHCASGIPIDFFATQVPHFWNYLVCRTGGKDNNMEIAMAAQRRGLKWHPTHSGFEVIDAGMASHALKLNDLRLGRQIQVVCEEDVYTLAGLPWREPQDRK